MLINTDDLAGIEYVGLPGISKESQDAVLRYLQYGDKIARVRILSSNGDHCLLLDVNEGDVVAVKSGFGSGYRGTGPGTFSYVLAVLEAHGAEILEYEVGPDMIERLDRSALTKADVETLKSIRPRHARHWMDYIFPEDRDPNPHERFPVWRYFPHVIPFSIVDARITDLALSFWENPDDRLMVGYRRLEDIVRKRTLLDEHGARLFSQAFAEKSGPLYWPELHAGEHAGRAQLFVCVYMMFRNPRAHREVSTYQSYALNEFLVLNLLFRLEREAEARTAATAGG